MIARVKELVAAKRLEGIADIKDLTDRKHGMRLVFEIKPGYDPEAILEELYRTSPLEESFSLNAVALIDSRPVTCDLLTLLHTFNRHRLDVIVRRTTFRLEKATRRAHILEGLITALASIEDVIAIIRASKDAETARTKLCTRLKIDEEQATHILDMPLRRLTGLEAGKLRDELRDLNATKKHLAGVLASPKKQRDMVGAELEELRSETTAPRKSALAPLTAADLLKAATPARKALTAPAAAVKIADEACTVALTVDGTLHKNSNQPAVSICQTTTHGTVLAVLDTGHALSIPVVELHDTPVPVATFAPGNTGRCVALLPLGANFAVGTVSGVVKRVAEDTPTTAQLERAGTEGVSVIALKDDDKVISAATCDDTHDLVFITANGQLLRANARHVRPQGKAAGGMAGIKLREDDRVIAFGSYDPVQPNQVIVATDAANGKTSPLAEYPTQGRATGGVRCITMRSADSTLCAAAIIPASAKIVPYDSKGKPFKHEWAGGRRDATGQPLAKLCTTIASQ